MRTKHHDLWMISSRNPLLDILIDQEFKASLSYRANLKTIWDKRACLKKKTKKLKNMNVANDAEPTINHQACKNLPPLP